MESKQTQWLRFSSCERRKSCLFTVTLTSIFASWRIFSNIQFLWTERNIGDLNIWTFDVFIPIIFLSPGPWAGCLCRKPSQRVPGGRPWWQDRQRGCRISGGFLNKTELVEQAFLEVLFGKKLRIWLGRTSFCSSFFSLILLCQWTSDS